MSICHGEVKGGKNSHLAKEFIKKVNFPERHVISLGFVDIMSLDHFISVNKLNTQKISI